jgi:hypothetical protein
MLTEEQFKMKSDAKKQEELIKAIIKDDETYSEIKDIF